MMTSDADHDWLLALAFMHNTLDAQRATDLPRAIRCPRCGGLNWPTRIREIELIGESRVRWSVEVEQRCCHDCGSMW